MTARQFFDQTYGSRPPEIYERYFVPAIGRPIAADLVRRAALRPGERVLDVACGTGIVARLAARQVGAGGTVAGLDVNPGMLAVARSVTPAELSIEWYESGAEEMPLPDEAFDVVLCQMGLQFMTDKPAALKEMRRVLAAGGRLFLNAPGPMEKTFATLAGALDQTIGPEAAGFVTRVFSLHDTTEVQELLSEAGFRDIVVRAGEKALSLPPPREFLWQYVHGTPLAGTMAKADEGTIAALERDVVSKWQAFEEDGRLVYQQRIVKAGAVK
ncbi:MAG TPA: methyltransferase domain-containing protein [Promineifilum sp.]